MLSKKPMSAVILKQILGEVRKLRQEISIFIPQESITEYVHPKRIKRSYQNALQQYPPRA